VAVVRRRLTREGSVVVMQGSLERPTEMVVWELRGAWAKRRMVRLSLTKRCLVPRVIGRVARVSVTGAWVEVDGWQVPTEEILAVGRPTLEEITEYEKTKAPAPTWDDEIGDRDERRDAGSADAPCARDGRAQRV
jgi:hypothetical protein